jgi:hypothetical protein
MSGLGEERKADMSHKSRITVLGLPAFRTNGGFCGPLTLVGSQRKTLLTLLASTNFKVGGPFLIDMSGQEQFDRVISNDAAVWELDDGQSVIEELEGGFLSLSSHDMPEDEHRLSLTFHTKVSQRMMRMCRAGKPATRTGAKDGC